MTRIEREKQTVRKMIGIYCRHHLKQESMPEAYQLLADYACQRLDHCQFGEQKKTCKRCPVHCYAPKEREQIRKVMRWTGPRILQRYQKYLTCTNFNTLNIKLLC